jgi:hypothetical protein
MIWYAILAAAINISNGMPVPTNPNELMAQAACLRCIPEGLLPYAILEALRTGGGGGGVTYGTSNPVAAPAGDSGMYYRTDTFQLWVWNSATATWDALIG